MMNTINRFDEEVLFMLDVNMRTRATGYMNKGAKWVICDDGACLVLKDVLLLRVSESYYKKNKYAQ